MPRIDTLLFDLDNTLVPERPNYERAFTDACAEAAARYELDLDRLREAVFTISDEMWRRSPRFEYCAALGIASPTTLLSEFAEGPPELVGLREWARSYRARCWSDALARLGVPRGATDALGREMDDSFRRRMRTACVGYDDAIVALAQLDRGIRLAVVSNGPSDVQDAKLHASGLRDFFAVTVFSGAVGIGKPDARIFAIALERIGVGHDAAVFIGDTQERDIAGARNAGLTCVWLNRPGTRLTREPHPDFEIATLLELPALVANLRS